MDKQEQGGVSVTSSLDVADKLPRIRWAIRDILQRLKSDRRVKISLVEKAIRLMDEANFGQSAKMLKAEFQPVFRGRKSTPELILFVQRLFDSVDTAISQRVNEEICSESIGDLRKGCADSATKVQSLTATTVDPSPEKAAAA